MNDRTALLWFLVLCFLVGTAVMIAFGADLPPRGIGECKSLTVEEICGTAWGKDVRHVTPSMRAAVLLRDGAPNCPSGKTELDHACSRELGGVDKENNLWLQCYEKRVAGRKPSETSEWGAYKKDRLENRLHDEVCAGRISLETAQIMIVTNWIAAYEFYFGEP